MGTTIKLKAKDGEWYAFSILMNNLPAGTNNTAKEVQERIVGTIDSNSVEKGERQDAKTPS